MIIAIKRFRRQKLFITLSPYNPMSKTKEFKITCYHKEIGKRKFQIGDLEYALRENNSGIPTFIYIDNMDVKEKYQKKGYGKILMRFVQGIAQASGLKISLFSLGEVIGFYRKCGFHASSRGSQDMVWIPAKRRKKHD